MATLAALSLTLLGLALAAAALLAIYGAAVDVGSIVDAFPA